MNKLEISNLSFCELAADKVAEVKGGLTAAENLAYAYSRWLLTGFFNPVSVQYTTEEFYSSSEYTVEKLETETTGKSGYVVSSRDGTSQAGVVVGRNSRKAFASSVYYA
ncbi:hypothetical protein [Nostoc sp. MG11]|uniref:hypothetical protein n=1 Tax=Nostoc sp. MG11 TaxID=2721166 RepID=UPI001865D4B0|nr:hypothetical protein [Nostoc sp. MG11]